MSMDPEPPTRRIPPTAPPPGAPPARVVAEDPRLLDLEDRVRSLRAWLAVATVLALAALGVAAWAIISKEEEDDTRAGASRASVNRLETQVEDLEAQVDNRATKESVSDLRAEQEELAEAVQQLGEGGGDTDELAQSVTTLSDDAQELAARIDELEQQQAEEEPVP